MSGTRSPLWCNKYEWLKSWRYLEWMDKQKKKWRRRCSEDIKCKWKRCEQNLEQWVGQGGVLVIRGRYLSVIRVIEHCNARQILRSTWVQAQLQQPGPVTLLSRLCRMWTAEYLKNNVGKTFRVFYESPPTLIPCEAEQFLMQSCMQAQ